MAVDAEGGLYVGGSDWVSKGVSDWRINHYDVGLKRVLATTTYHGSGKGHEGLRAMVLDAQGRLIVVGRTVGMDGRWDWHIRMYSPDLRRVLADLRYDGPGHGDDIANGMALLPDRSIVVVGSEWGVGGGHNWRIIRYDSDLSSMLGTTVYDASPAGLHPKQENNQQTMHTSPGSDVATAVAVAADGSVIVGGNELCGINQTIWRIRRYDRTLTGLLGTVAWEDPTLQWGGLYGLAVAPDGKVIAGGSSGLGDHQSQWQLIAYSASLDRQLGAATYTDDENRDSLLYALAVDRQGRVFATGSAHGYGDGHGDLAIVRFAPDLSAATAHAAVSPDRAEKPDLNSIPGQAGLGIAFNHTGHVVVVGFRDDRGGHETADDPGRWLVRVYQPGLDGAVPRPRLAPRNTHESAWKVRLDVSGPPAAAALAADGSALVVGSRPVMLASLVVKAPLRKLKSLAAAFGGLNDPPADSVAHEWHVVRLDSSGRTRWTQKLRGDEDSYAMAAVLTSDGAAVVGGCKTVGSRRLWCVAAWARDGRLQWERLHDDGAEQSWVSAAAGCRDGGFVLAGSRYVNAGAHLGSELLVMRCRSDGTAVWTRTLSGPPGTHLEVGGVCVDTSGDILLAGSTGLRVGSFDQHAAAWKYRGDGVPIWAAVDPRTDSYGYAGGVAPDGSGGVYFAGGSIPLDTKLGGDGFSWRTGHTFMRSGQSGYRGRWDSRGNLVWSAKLNDGVLLGIAAVGTTLATIGSGTSVGIGEFDGNGRMTGFVRDAGLGVAAALATNEHGELLGLGQLGENGGESWIVRKWKRLSASK